MRKNKFIQFQVVIEADKPSGFHAFVPTLPGCHSFGATKEKARLNIIEAIQGYLKTAPLR